VWKPQEKQERALLSTAFETLYGGARGGGKTDAGMAWLLYGVDHPRYRALVIRKNETDLKDWLDRAARMYSGTRAKFIGRPAEIHFPSGAKIYTGHLKDDQAYTKYQGHEYQRMLIEELTHIPSEDSYLRLVSSCRSTIELRPMIFATTNPGGIGHSWVKKRFIDPARPMTYYSDEKSGRTRIYIPATVDDNAFLKERDPDYVKFLESLPEDLKAQWRYGSWEEMVIKGSYFGEDLDRAQKENRIGNIPMWEHEPVHVAWDLGLSDDQTAWFYQIKGKEIRILESFTQSGKVYDYYAEMLRNKPYKYGEMVLPHDAVKRSADTLRSFQDVLTGAGYVCRIIPRTKDKPRDIQKVRTILPMCWFNSEKCADGLEALKSYRREWDEQKQVYRDVPVHDWSSHYADGFIALSMSLPEPSNESEYEREANRLMGKQDMSELGIKAKDYAQEDHLRELEYQNAVSQMVDL